jgi:hypothetical protein
MKKLLNVSTANLVRAGALLCGICFVTLFGCNDTIPVCEITVSGPGSLCNIVYNDSQGVTHAVIIQSDSEIITIEDCDEVLEVNCS